MSSSLHCEAASARTHLVNFNTKNAFSIADETETITQLCFKYRLFVNFLSEYLYTENITKRGWNYRNIGLSNHSKLQQEVFHIKLINSPYCRPFSVMRSRTPGFVACINRKARNEVNIDIIDLIFILSINFQLSSRSFQN